MNASHLVPMALAVAMTTLLLPGPATAGPTDALDAAKPQAPACDLGETTHDRVFPEPQESVDFISFGDAICGLEMLEDRHEDLISVHRVGDSHGWENRVSGSYDTFPILAVEVTDHTLPMDEKEGNLVFINSVHGNEKGPREGSLRVIEDLVTGQGLAEEVEQQLDTTAADALEQIRLVFTFPNPDGWVHEHAEYRANDACYVSATCMTGATDAGDPGLETQNFVRTNGNGTDLNRQYPTVGTPHPGWPPLNEPEIHAQHEYLQSLEGDTLAGTDLHGMLNAENLTYIMLKDTQRDLLDVPRDEALASTAASYIADNEALDPWRETMGPAVVWGNTYDLLGYSSPGTGGSYIVQETGLDAPGFTVELAFNHITFDNYYPGPGQVMNILHVEVMRSLVLGFIDYALDPPTQAHTTGSSTVGVLDHPGLLEDARPHGEHADPNHVFDEILPDRHEHLGPSIQDADPALLEDLTHLVAPNIDPDELDHDTLASWVEEGGTLVLTDQAIGWLASTQKAQTASTHEDVTGFVQRTDTDHALMANTNEPVGTLVDGNALNYDIGSVPIHCLEGFDGGSVAERVNEDRTPCTVVGETTLGEGTIRVIGTALPAPQAGAPNGVNGHALSPNGYHVLANALDAPIATDGPGGPLDPDRTDEEATVPGPAAFLLIATLLSAPLAAPRAR